MSLQAPYCNVTGFVKGEQETHIVSLSHVCSCGNMKSWDTQNLSFLEIWSQDRQKQFAHLASDKECSEDGHSTDGWEEQPPPPLFYLLVKEVFLSKLRFVFFLVLPQNTGLGQAPHSHFLGMRDTQLTMPPNNKHTQQIYSNIAKRMDS